MDKKISIIIPVYNVENYITNCIKSVIDQSYTNFEIIIVDDGSPDGSIDICRKLLNQTNYKYRIISRANKGVSASRNDGIYAARGEYLVFVDADDILDNQFLFKLQEKIDEDNPSCVVFSSFELIIDGVPKKSAYSGQTCRLTKEEALWGFLYRRYKFILPAMLVNRQYIMNNQILFDEDCRYSEDVVYIWKILSMSEGIRYIDEPLYKYILHPGSTMTASKYSKILTSRDAILRLFNDYILKLKQMEEFKKIFLSRYFLGILHSAAKLISFHEFKALLSELDLDGTILIHTHSYQKRVSLIAKIYKINKRIFYFLLRLK